MSQPVSSLSGDSGTAGSQGGWTCPVCFFYCQRDWLVCPVCDFVRPADFPMDDDIKVSEFCILRAAVAQRAV
jgi:hypothetical protein